MIKSKSWTTSMTQVLNTTSERSLEGQHCERAFVLFNEADNRYISHVVHLN